MGKKKMAIVATVFSANQLECYYIFISSTSGQFAFQSCKSPKDVLLASQETM